MKLPWRKTKRKRPGYVSLLPLESQAIMENFDFEQAPLYYDWVAEFDLTVERDRQRVKIIAALSEIPGQTFRIQKDVATPGSISQQRITVTEIDSFPSRDHLWAIVGESWGGGTYLVTAKSRPAGILKTYTFAEPAKVPGVKEPKGRTPREAELRERIEARALDTWLSALEQNPEQWLAFSAAMAAKKFGVAMPGSQRSWRERLLEDAVQNDPTLREAMTRRAVEAELKTDKDFDTEVKRFERVASTLGWQRPGTENGAKPESLMSMAVATVRELAAQGQIAEIFEHISHIVASAQQPPRPQIAGTTADPLSLMPAGDQTAAPNATGQSAPRVIQRPRSVQPSSTLGREREATPIPGTTEPITSVPPNAGEWIALLLNADPDALLVGLHDDARVFIRECYRMAVDDDDEVGGTIIQMIRDNDPAILNEQIKTQVVPRLTGEWRALGETVFGADRYSKGMAIVNRLASEEGLQWLRIAHGMCHWMEKKIAEGIHKPEDTEEDPNGPKENDEQMA